MDDDPIRALQEALERHRSGFVVVVTGAGISLASGIPTFRGSDPGAVWKRDVTELATFRFFREDPVGSWQWYLERFAKVRDKRPNPAHHAVAALERWQLGSGRPFLLITQNIDTLHEDAGSREMIKVHGSSDRVRCPRTGCSFGAPKGSIPRREIDLEPFLEAPSLDTVPRCPACGDVLRQHVLWFDEYYSEHDDYQWDRVRQAAATADLLLFVGTSFAVGVTDLFVQSGLVAGATMMSVDPGGTPPPYPGIRVLAAKAEELLPAVCREFGAEL